MCSFSNQADYKKQVVNVTTFLKIFDEFNAILLSANHLNKKSTYHDHIAQGYVKILHRG